MTRRNLTVALLLCVFALMAGCQGKPLAQPSPAPTQSPPPTATPSPKPAPVPTPTPDPVAQELGDMTTEEKVGQLLIAGIEGTVPGADAVAAVQDYKVGGVILFRRNIERAGQLTALTNGLKALSGTQIPLFLCVDQEGGLVDRMPSDLSRTPSPRKAIYGADGEAAPARAAALGSLLGAECAAFGFHVNFAPVLDVGSNPDNTAIYGRTYGDDWEYTADLGLQAAYGMISQGVIPVVKHFPGQGGADVDSHKELPVIDRTMEELRQDDLVPFRLAIEGYHSNDTDNSSAVPAVMVGHLLITALDGDRPASLSRRVVTDLLGDEMGFEGVVFTDDLTMGAISNTYGMGEAAVLALEAGCDSLLVCHGADNLAQAHTALMDAVASGRVSQTRLDQSVYRILSLKREYAVTSDPVPEADVDALNTQIKALLT